VTLINNFNQAGPKVMDLIFSDGSMLEFSKSGTTHFLTGLIKFKISVAPF